MFGQNGAGLFIGHLPDVLLAFHLPSARVFFANERCENRKGVALTVSGRMSEYAPDGTRVWTHDDPYQHHDTRCLADGAVYAAFTELDDDVKVAIPGGAPGTETEGGPFGEVVWEWHFTELGLDSHPLHRNSNRWSYGHTNTVLSVG